MGDAAQRAALLRESVTRLPIFNGDGTDALTPEQWIERIDKARVTTGWDDAQTLSFLYTSLRGVSLHWYEGLGRNKIPNTYAAFRPAFLSCFAPMQTARSAVITLHDIKQGATELVVAFHSRIIKVLNDLEAIIPAASRTPAEMVYAPEILAVNQFVALADNVKDTQLVTMVNLGVTAAMNHIGIQLFVAGLKHQIRDKMMEQMPADLWAALHRALDLEKIHCPPSKVFPAVNEIDDVEAGEVDGEIEAIQKRLANLQNRRAQWRPQGQSNKSKGKFSAPAGNRKQIICRCCEKIGHMQDVCHTRINKRLPCVDQNGAPLKVQPPFPDTPQKRRGGVSEVESQQPSNPLVGAPQNGFAPPSNQNGFWTPFPPNFP